jgi:hypothetical protein
VDFCYNTESFITIHVCWHNPENRALINNFLGINIYDERFYTAAFEWST